MRIDIIPKHFFPPSGHIKGEIETREISQEIPSLFIGFEKKTLLLDLILNSFIALNSISTIKKCIKVNVIFF